MNAEMHIEPVRQKAVWGSRIRIALAITGALLVSLLLTSCSDMVRTGQSPASLVMNSLQGAAGSSSTFGNTLQSDVLTVVSGVPTIFADNGRADVVLQLKDQGGANGGAAPSPANAVTITQYHVRYFRSDGHNVQGVDVPFEFDGAVTITISGAGAIPFTLVRVQAKEEAPLLALRGGAPAITTVAEVTFFGHDQNGRDVNVGGRIEVTFANWGDSG